MNDTMTALRDTTIPAMKRELLKLKKPRNLLGILVFIAIVIGNSLSDAKPIFIANGKAMSQGAAENLQRKDPTTKVFKISAQQVKVNDESGNFKKSEDVDFETLKTLIK